jgi:hypothetical protein
MVTGGLVTPRVDAVIWAVPGFPGVQTWGTVNEFQVPAQACPLSAIVTTAVLLDWNVNLSAAGVALKARPLPTSREMLGPGVSETPVGGTSGEIFVGLLLPHEGRSTQAMIRKAKQIAEKNFPMKPFKKECLACSGKLSV